MKLKLLFKNGLSKLPQKKIINVNDRIVLEKSTFLSEIIKQERNSTELQKVINVKSQKYIQCNLKIGLKESFFSLVYL